MPGAYIVFYLDLRSFFSVVKNPANTRHFTCRQARTLSESGSALVVHKSPSMTCDIVIEVVMIHYVYFV